MDHFFYFYFFFSFYKAFYIFFNVLLRHTHMLVSYGCCTNFTHAAYSNLKKKTFPTLVGPQHQLHELEISESVQFLLAYSLDACRGSLVCTLRASSDLAGKLTFKYNFMTCALCFFNQFFHCYF